MNKIFFLKEFVNRVILVIYDEEEFIKDLDMFGLIINDSSK